MKQLCYCFIQTMTVHTQIALRKIFTQPSLAPAILLLFLQVWPAWAVDSIKPPSHYIQTRFTDKEGLSSNLVEDIAQSKEGFLWLKIEGNDLARFDGRHFYRISGLGSILSLAMAPNGDLWVGTADDLKQIPANALNQFGPMPMISHAFGTHNPIYNLRFTRNGVLWVATAAGLYRFENNVSSLVIPGSIVDRIEETAGGHLWLTTRSGIQEWDGSQSIPHPELEAQLGVKGAEIFHVFEDSHGVTWFCTMKGVARRSRPGGPIEKLAHYGLNEHDQAVRVYEDPNGRLWFAKQEGLFQATSAGLELVAAGIQVRNMYGDQDGNLWVSTNGDGLFRFKESAVRMFTTADGFPNKVTMTVLAAHDGTVWTGFNCGGLAHFDGQRFQFYNEKNGLSNSCVWDMAEDANHDLWVGTWGGGAFHFHEGKFTQFSKAQGLAGDTVFSIVAAQDKSVWFLQRRAGVARLQNGRIHNYTVTDGLLSMINRTVYEDKEGGIWVQSAPTGTNQLIGDRFTSSSFLRQVELGPIGEDRKGGLYFMVPSPRGIFRFADGQATQVTSDLVAQEIQETAQGDLWLMSVDGIFRVPPGGLEHAIQQDEPLDLETFGTDDGLTVAQPSGGSPVSALTPDGKLWIATNQGLAMLDLSRMQRTDRKPSLYVEAVTVGRNQQLPGRELTLPAGTHHVELNFDAIEIGAPEKIRFQYRLDSVDTEWLDAKSSQRAIYSNIPPGRHAFHVRACNRSGIWDRVGMVYYVTQQPYFYQTRWFLAAMIAFVLLTVAGLYQLRMRQVVAGLNMRLEERVTERTRIARELHDTLLQTLSASLLRLQSVSKMLPGRPDEAKQRVDSAIEQASNAIAEGRDAVHELRSGGMDATGLAQSINNFVSELLSSSLSENPPEVRVHVEGTPRNLNPMVRDEAYRIAVEALRNAVRYSAARQIEAEIHYDAQQLRLRIRDDGKGMDPSVLEQGHAPGRWGLRGMRERAKLLSGNFEVWSEVGSGTEVELTVPAANAYSKPVSRWPIFQRGKRN